MGEAADVIRRAFALTNANDTEGMAAIADPGLEENGDAVMVETSAEMHGKASGAEAARTDFERG